MSSSACLYTLFLNKSGFFTCQLFNASTGDMPKIKRFGRMLAREHQRWNMRNLEALSGLREQLTPENRRIYDEFCCFRDASLWKRLAGLYRSGLYRQTFEGNITLWLAALFKRI